MWPLYPAFKLWQPDGASPRVKGLNCLTETVT